MQTNFTLRTIVLTFFSFSLTHPVAPFTTLCTYLCHLVFCVIFKPPSTILIDFGYMSMDLSCSLGLFLSCLLHILDRFCFGLRLIRAPNKPAGYHFGSGTCRAKTISYQDISSHFFAPVISYHFSGHLVPSFIMGFNSLMRLFCLSKFTFYIGYYTRK